jgi:hypothetical protein
LDYRDYTDKHIRNKETLSEEEQALAELQANQEVEQFLSRFKDEPRFFKRIAPKLAGKLLDHIGS